MNYHTPCLPLTPPNLRQSTCAVWCVLPTPLLSPPFPSPPLPPSPPPLPPIGTPYDMVNVSKAPGLLSQITSFQWNYKDVYVPPHLLHDLLAETTAIEQQNAVWMYGSMTYGNMSGSIFLCRSTTLSLAQP